MNQDVANHPIFSKVPFETPNLFASYRIGDFPRARLLFHPWKITNTQAVLVNAFDLLANQRTRMFTPKVREKPGKLREYIEFEGPLMLDSGAFNFQKQKKISIDPVDVLSIGIEFTVDISVVLDHPFLPASKSREKSKRWKNTVENTRRMFAELNSRNGDIPDNFHLMPVIHDHNPRNLKRRLNDILKIYGSDPPIIGIGSLAPLALNGNKRTAIDIIYKVRELLPNSHIHCFSMGSALLMLFAFYSGADTVDSQSWMLSAAFKNVQLPGFHWTRFSQREKDKDHAKYQQNRNAFAEHLLYLTTEEGFVVKDWDDILGETWSICNLHDALSYIDYLEDCDGKNHIHRRACHNLYAFNFEANRVRQEMKKGISSLETFIEGRMKSTVYRKTFEHAVNKVNSKS